MFTAFFSFVIYGIGTSNRGEQEACSYNNKLKRCTSKSLRVKGCTISSYSQLVHTRAMLVASTPRRTAVALPSALL
jgi:hypothetical protein